MTLNLLQEFQWQLTAWEANLSKDLVVFETLARWGDVPLQDPVAKIQPLILSITILGSRTAMQCLPVLAVSRDVDDIDQQYFDVHPHLVTGY